MYCNPCQTNGSSNYRENLSASCENCFPINDFCDMCAPILNPVTKFYSYKYSNLETNYPVRKCLCNNYGTNTRYYSSPYVPCDCAQKCYPC